jgi:hypothetical protein
MSRVIYSFFVHFMYFLHFTYFTYFTCFDIINEKGGFVMNDNIILRKIYDRHGSLSINIPKKIAKLLKIEKGNYLKITHDGKTKIILEKL